MTDVLTPDLFELETIELSSDRLPLPIILAGSGESASVVSQLNIYENINRPYLTGNLIMVDDNDLYRIINLQGTERVKIRYKAKSLPGANTNSTDPIEKIFIVVNVASQVKTNDYSSVLLLNLIEDIGFYDQNLSISKAYTGTGEKIIEKIIKDKLNREVDMELMKNPYQGAFRYIVPYITPLQAARQVLKKITTKNGLPYFLFSTLASNDFILTDLESIFENRSFNYERPFVFDAANVHSTESSLSNEIYNIEKYRVVNSDDTLKLLQAGAIGNKYSNYNLTYGKKRDVDISMKNKLDTMINDRLFYNNLKKTIIDDKFMPDPSEKDTRTIDQHLPVYNYEISSSPYPLDSYLGFSEEQQQAQYDLRMIRDSILKHMATNIYNIQVPSFAFNSPVKDVSIGRLIDIVVRRNVIDHHNSQEQRKIDERRSGEFVMLTKRHLFDIIDNTHTISMEVGRPVNPEVED